MTTWKQLRKKILSDPEVKKEYNRLAPRYAIISQLIAARTKKKITQKELADRLGTKQSAIARLEGGNINLSLEWLEKIATALGYKLSIQLQ